MNEYDELRSRVERMEARVDRLTRIRQLLEGEIDDIIESARIDIAALRLQLDVAAYEGRAPGRAPGQDVTLEVDATVKPKRRKDDK